MIRPHTAPAAVLVAAVLAAAPAARAQAPEVSARPEDVSSPERLVAAAYQTISGPAGPRDWGRFRSLFWPGARMTVATVRPDGVVAVRALSAEEYVERNGPALLKEGFVEHGVRQHVDRWAHTATVRSLYESRHAASDPKPFARGVNTFQLVSDGRRWWIASLAWEGESPSAPLPADRLP